MNDFTLEEEQTTNSAQRRISARLTNEAFGHAAALFGGLSRSKHIPQPPGSPSYERQPLVPFQGQQQIEDSTEASGEVRNSSSFRGTVEEDHEDNGTSEASKYFKLRGEDLVSQFSDFKGPTKRAQQERFILLFAWAYNEMVERAPSREQVTEAAKKRKLYDTNFANYYADVANQYLLGGNEELELNPDGHQRVEEILEQMNDTSGEQGFAYWKGTSQPRAKRTSANAEDKQKLSRWVDMEIDIGEIDVRALNTPTICAMFAIWCLTRRLGVVKAVKPNVALSYVRSKYTTVSVNQKAFTKALGRAKNGHRFNKNGEGLYYLTANAEQEVESWVRDGVPKPRQAEGISDG